MCWHSKNTDFLGFLKLFDLLYMSTKFKVDGIPHPGSWPHIRVQQDREPQYTSKPVAGPSQNCYAELWLEQLGNMDPVALEELNVQAAINLSNGPGIVAGI